uniref:Uncharacterized protein n=1 Tax=Anguilla anguilla TaxID=7936 RepID=A0A0E9VVV9_ANGAN
MLAVSLASYVNCRRALEATVTSGSKDHF